MCREEGIEGRREGKKEEKVLEGEKGWFADGGGGDDDGVGGDGSGVAGVSIWVLLLMVLCDDLYVGVWE